MSLDIQWLTIVVMLMAGAGMGVLFDSYRVVTDHFKWPKWSVSILDMLYWLASAITVFRLLYLSNFGEVRGYVYIGLVLGVIIYALLFSKLYSKLVMIIISIIKGIIRIIMNIIDYTIVKPVKIMYKFVTFCIKIGTKFTIRTIQIMLQLFIPILKVLLWPLKPLFKPLLGLLKQYWMKWVHPTLTAWQWLGQVKATLSKVFNSVKTWIYN